MSIHPGAIINSTPSLSHEFFQFVHERAPSSSGEGASYPDLKPLFLLGWIKPLFTGYNELIIWERVNKYFGVFQELVDVRTIFTYFSYLFTSSFHNVGSV